MKANQWGKAVLMAIATAVLLTACGGGGGSASAPAGNSVTATSSNWDALIWEQGNWQ
ncbi:MAG: hypothetical protein HOO97_03980 [Sideroxydans sp.]|nr:hypothetical protein [Sideroxydans sp.]NOT98238.1 hypothetical protein [Sideroxydans sp.]